MYPEGTDCPCLPVPNSLLAGEAALFLLRCHGLRSWSAGRFPVIDAEDKADKEQWPETRRKFLATMEENILRKDNWIVNR